MYDDFAILDESQTVLANKEYLKKHTSDILSVKVSAKDQENIWQKVEYLQNLLQKLKNNTKNQDTLLVLDNLVVDVQNQKDKLSVLFENNIITQKQTEPKTIMFCNNLKLATQTTNEIVKHLIEQKDSEQTAGELRPQYTQIILSFLDINNILVSLFGECRHRVFRQKHWFKIFK